jgi:hypothetical protein
MIFLVVVNRIADAMYEYCFLVSGLPTAQLRKRPQGVLMYHSTDVQPLIPPTSCHPESRAPFSRTVSDRRLLPHSHPTLLD